ncbi:hypothetical protein FCM35_KLT00438 [Carex littledalei]|uniref:Glabrous enhancer-binding protein-like DBD domain-containing protein n=1 Tax=Carex littledalei TaxID=544730 RepID=A0A833RAM4_9POAL|nr:hypothetical protein FCM35_KLT00438 [Carex littledalei]
MSPPPAAALSSSSDDDSSSVEAQFIVQHNPPHPERDDNKSDSDSRFETDTNPLTKTQKTPQKPSELEDSSEEDEEEEREEVENPKLPAMTLKTPQKLLESDDSFEEDEEEEQEQMEKLRSPAKEPESQPDKKKLKLSVPDQATSHKSSSIHRIWCLDDEMVLLRALSEFQIRNGKLPPRKDFASLLSAISGSISFPVTETQIFYKIRQLRHIYSQKRKKGFDINLSQPHEKIMFDMYAKLFEGTSKVSKKRASPETYRDTESESSGKHKKRITEPGSLMAANGGAVLNEVARSYLYLAGLIKDMISTQQCPRWLSTVEDVVMLIGESKVKDLEAKSKMLRINEIKSHARKEKLMAELFDILSDEMVRD